MRLSIISFTEKGMQLSQKIEEILKETESVLFTKCSTCLIDEQKVQTVDKNIREWVKEQFEERNALLFIGACGIAVRGIAPYITDKLQDSPVLVMDERGQYVIPILSGHMGGANELAALLAAKTGAEAIVTTATDINNKFAVDLFAKRNGCFIANSEEIAKISARVLAGKTITMSVETGHLKNEYKTPKGIELVQYPPLQPVDIVVTSENKKIEAIMLLKPREYVIGMGCKKGKEPEKIEAFILKNLKEAGISITQVAGLASIDVKKEEPGFLAWSRKENILFYTYTAEELMGVEGIFHKSEFVRTQVGADNVCERAALRLCGPEGKLVYEKHAEDGMTFAIAKKGWRVEFDEE